MDSTTTTHLITWQRFGRSCSFPGINTLLQSSYTAWYILVWHFLLRDLKECLCPSYSNLFYKDIEQYSRREVSDGRYWQNLWKLCRCCKILYWRLLVDYITFTILCFRTSKRNCQQFGPLLWRRDQPYGKDCGKVVFTKKIFLAFYNLNIADMLLIDFMLWILKWCSFEYLAKLLCSKDPVQHSKRGVSDGRYWKLCRYRRMLYQRLLVVVYINFSDRSCMNHFILI